MKRLRSIGIVGLLSVMVILLALFFSDFLMGVEHLELQHPYSRAVHITHYRFGLHSDHEESNAMSDYYYKVLKQPHNDSDTVLLNCDDSYRIRRFTWRIVREKGPFAPVTELNPAIEYEFMQVIPDNKARLAVIHSLFRKRDTDKSAAAIKHNQMLAAEEKVRSEKILSWHAFDRNDPTISSQQWWLKNAVVFGLTPEGDLLPEASPDRSAQ